MTDTSFIQNLSEAKLFGNGRSGIQRFNAREIADIFFLHMLALQILKNEFYGLPKAQEYLQGTGNVVNFDYYVQSRNEIYVMLHLLIGKYSESQRRLLKDQEASQELLEQVRIPLQPMRKYLRLIMSGRNDEGFERRFLLELEAGLLISNSYYRSIRRLASSWRRQPESVKHLTMTRLLQIFRSKARRSGMMPIIEWMSKKENLEDKSLDPLEGEGLGQTVEKKPGIGFLKGLALAGGGALAGYHLTRRKKNN